VDGVGWVRKEFCRVRYTKHLNQDIFVMKNRFFAKAALVAAFAIASTVAFAVPQMPVDESVSQGSGMVTPGQAVGFIKADRGFSNYKGEGGLAVCAAQSFGGSCTVWVTPAEFIKREFPSRKYVGFQLFLLKDGPQLYLYYR